MNTTAADRAINHLLWRIKDDPRLAYYFDPFTKSMELLTAAYAEAHGVDLAAFRKEFYDSLRFDRPVCTNCREGV